MLAGVSHGGFPAAFSLNPALLPQAERFHAGASYSRPYGLDGLDWGQLAGGVRHGTWAWGVGITSLGLDRYRESDVQATVRELRDLDVVRNVGGLLRVIGD